MSASIDILVNDKNVDFFEVYFEDEKLEEVTALYLYKYCGSHIEKNTKILSLDEINTLKNKFYRELERADKSIWHKSNKEMPYPNLALLI